MLVPPHCCQELTRAEPQDWTAAACQQVCCCHIQQQPNTLLPPAQELTRAELHDFFLLVANSSLLKARSIVTRTPMFSWRDNLEQLEDYIWRVRNLMS